MPAEVESLVYARAVPWHGFGLKVEGLMTAEECIVAAGLDWEVAPRPLYIRKPGSKKGDLVKVTSHVATTRMTDGQVMGIVSPSYKIVQNVEAFAMADAIVESGEAKYETAGSLRGGKVVFLSMELPKTIHVPGDNGDVQLYFLLSNTFDGSKKLAGRITKIRVVCKNTLDAGLGDFLSEFNFRHTLNVTERIEDAQKALRLTVEHADAFERLATKMALTKVTPKDTLQLLLTVFPIKDVNPLKLSAAEMRRILDEHHSTPAAKALRMYQGSPNLEGIRQTAWGLYNGVAEYLDYGQFYRAREVSAADNRATSILLDGPAVKAKVRTAALLAKLN